MRVRCGGRRVVCAALRPVNPGFFGVNVHDSELGSGSLHVRIEHDRPAVFETVDQTRARYPDEAGYVERGGVRVAWERYGSGERAVLFLPTWEIVHSRVWKCQIPYFARDFRAVTFDPRGNGRSDRPVDPAAYDRREIMADAIAILDSLGVDQAVVVSWCGAVGVLLAAEHPTRVSALVEIAPDLPLTEDPRRGGGVSVR